MHRASHSFMSDQTTLPSDEGKPSGELAARDRPMSDNNIPQLPKGAATPAYQQSIRSPTRSQIQADNISPPATPSPTQRLLDAESQPQYASYTGEKPEVTWATTPVPEHHTWIPYPLRPWFWIPFFVLLVLVAIGLEIALHFSNKNNGWPSHGDASDDESVWHYVYTLPPSFAAMILVALWAWIDIEIKKMQPYVDLIHGDSPPQRSLLLDYTRSNNFYVWTKAAHNKHYLVALTTLMVLLSLSFQPLAGALLVVNPTWMQMPDVTVNNLAHLGLNQNANFDDLTSFLAAAGYASASVQYSGIPSPPFIYGQYAVAPFELPTGITPNGTYLYANTSALMSKPNCENAPVTMTQLGGGSWNNSITSAAGCSLQWEVENTTDLLFGVDATNCSSSTPQFSPVAFWFFQYTPSVQASATICSPTFQLFDVQVTYDFAANSIVEVTQIGPFTSSSNFSSAAGNITGAPLEGRAYNGIEFNFTTPPDQFVLARRAAIQLQLPAAVLQNAQQSSAGLQGSFTADSFAGVSAQVYTIYLALLAQTVYFIPSNELNTIQVRTTVERVFLSGVAVHLLAIGLIILAIFGTIAQLFHRFDRRQLRLRHEPGTIASAVSFGGASAMGQLLSGRQDQKDIDHVLSNKKFRIDPQTMKIIMEGEDGYDYASSPHDRRKSVFAALQGNWGKAPTSPGKTA